MPRQNLGTPFYVSQNQATSTFAPRDEYFRLPHEPARPTAPELGITHPVDYNVITWVIIQ